MSSLSADDVKGMKVADLRSALEERGLSTKGLKADLAARLTEALEEGGGEAPEAAAAAAMDADAEEGGKEEGEEPQDKGEGEEPGDKGDQGKAEEAAAPPPAKPVDADEGEVFLSVRVDGFVAPVSEEQVKDMLRELGTIRRFWASKDVRYVYVTYQAASEAEAAAAVLEGRAFVNDAVLKAQLASEADADGAWRAEKDEARASKNAKDVERAQEHREAVSAEALAAERASVDERFVLTEAEPRIFYRPHTAEEVEERAARGADECEAEIKADAARFKAALKGQQEYFASRNGGGRGGGRGGDAGDKRGRDDDFRRGGGGGKRRRRVSRADRDRW